MPKSRVKITIYGKVKGVGFRKAAQDFANKLGITGWALNTETGQVVMTAEGSKADIKKFIEWCKVGPKNAQVERCEPYYQKYKDEFTKFEILAKKFDVH